MSQQIDELGRGSDTDVVSLASDLDTSVGGDVEGGGAASASACNVLLIGGIVDQSKAHTVGSGSVTPIVVSVKAYQNM